MGRFINGDVLVSTGQGILGNNMFAYCGNNPINYSDNAGMLSKKVLLPEFFGSESKSPWHPPLDVEHQSKDAQEAEKFFFEMISAKNPLEYINQNTKLDTFIGGAKMTSGLKKIRTGYFLIVSPVPTLADEVTGFGYILWGFSSIIAGLDDF